MNSEQQKRWQQPQSGMTEEAAARRQRAIATASLTAAGRLTGEARQEAMQAHFRLVRRTNRSCPIRPAR